MRDGFIEFDCGACGGFTFRVRLDGCTSLERCTNCQAIYHISSCGADQGYPRVYIRRQAAALPQTSVGAVVEELIGRVVKRRCRSCGANQFE